MRLVVPPEAAGQRFDRFLAERAGLSRARAQKLIEAGAAALDGRPAAQDERLRAGQAITYTLPPPQPTDLVPEPIPLDISYEDADLLVVNKPRGLVVHPGAGRRTGTLVNALLARVTDLSGVGGRLRPGIVHRLDKDTSGLLLVAKNDFAHHALTAQLARRQVERRYLALVWGTPPQDEFDIEAPIARHPVARTRMAVLARAGARPAATRVWMRERLGCASLVEARLATGRTHQIRVHLAHVGYPLLGDPTYGTERGRQLASLLGPQSRRLLEALGGQALHAYFLAFTHPRSGQRLAFQVLPPPPFQELLAALRRECAEKSRATGLPGPRRL